MQPVLYIIIPNKKAAVFLYSVHKKFERLEKIFVLWYNEGTEKNLKGEGVQ